MSGGRGRGGLLSLAMLLSRVMGLLREQLFAALLGASALADAFVAAFRIPNLFRDLLAEGALSASFTPEFQRELEGRGGQATAYQLAATVAGTLLVIVGGIALALGVFAPQLLAVLLGDFAASPGKLEVTVLLLRLMLPFLLLVSAASIAMGMLTSQQRFVTPALAPATFNLVAIVVGAMLYVAEATDRWVVIGWAIGTVASGVAQLAIQLPALWRLGWRPRLAFDLRLRDPGVRRVLRALVPAIVGVAALQINVFVNTVFASREPGAVAWLNYAFRFLQLPIGVFGVAIGTVAATRFASAAGADDRDGLARELIGSLRMVLLLCVPATVGLLVLAEPIVRLVYEHGQFRAADTASTAAVLRTYALGLPAFAMIKVLAPVYYALGYARVPMLAALAAIAANVVAAMLWYGGHGFVVLGASTAAAATLNVIILWSMLRAAVPGSIVRALAGVAGKIAIAAGAMAVVVWSAHRGLDGWLGHAHTRQRLVETLGAVVLGAIVFAAIGVGLRIAEVTDALASAARSLRRR